MRRKRPCLFIEGIIAFLILSAAAFAQQLPDVQAAIKARGLKWRAEETSVSALPDHERRMRLGLIKHAPTGTEEVLALSETVPPGDIDWRSFATPVKDQGSCGSCWAFATTAALESYLLLRDNLPNGSDDRSEQVLVSCGSAGNCNGGYIDGASNFIQSTGLPPESYYSYTGTNGSCRTAGSGWQLSAEKIASWAWVTTTPANLNAIKTALAAYGPLVTTMDVYDDFFYYSGGVYEYTNSAYAGGHAILIVGYKDDTSVDGGGYFIVKNSWGNWGESGYFRIAYSQLGGPVYFGEYTIAYKQPPDPALPLAPSNLKAAAPAGGPIKLSWTDNSSNEDGFFIEKCAGIACPPLPFTSVSAGITSYTDIDLFIGTSYTYRVYAHNSVGDSGYSNLASVTPACAFSLSPTGNTFTATGGQGSVTVTVTGGCSWTAKSNAPDWITTSTGTLPGTFNYSVRAMTGKTPRRTGTISVGTATFTVTQTRK